MKRLGLGDLGAGRRKDATHASEKIEGLGLGCKIVIKKVIKSFIQPAPDLSKNE
jgi:hypothetical protein